MIEAKPNMIKKFNKPIYGLLIGLVVPLITFFIYYLVQTHADVNLVYFYTFLKSSSTLTPVLSLCVLPNLIPYFIFKKLDYWYAIKGLIMSILIYVIVVLVLKFV